MTRLARPNPGGTRLHQALGSVWCRIAGHQELVPVLHEGDIYVICPRCSREP